MVDTTFLHIGLPKTATSYLQTILWANRDLLRDRGVVIPGEERRDHLWASRTVREERSQSRAPERHRTAWQRIRAELEGAAGTGLISHEFFAAASAGQARSMVEALPGEVHVVITAREPLGLFTASWQESLKNGSTTPMVDYGREESPESNAIWNWRTLDLRLVLERWREAVPPERIHILVLDPAAPREDVWLRFASIVGFDVDGIDLSGSFPNTSMGVAEAETLRRVNGALDGFTSAFDRGVYIRTFLADERLVPRGGARFRPEPDQVADCRRRGEEALALLRSAPWAIDGDLEHLRVPATLPEQRSTTSVSDAEVAEVAVDLVAQLTGEVRRLRRRVARTEAEARGQVGRLARWRNRLRRLR